MIQTSSVLVAVLLLTTLGAPLQAQTSDIVRPGHDALDTTPIRAGVDSLAIFYFDGDDVFAIGTLVIEITIEEGIITRAEEALGIDDEVIWGERQAIEDGTLKPRSSSALGDRGAEVVIDGTVARRSWVEGGESVERVANIEAGAFFPAALDLVIRSLPLEEGYRATLSVLNLESLSEVEIPIHVARAVLLADATGARHRTWEIHVDLGGAVDVYHVDQETHALVRHESAMDGLVMLKW